MTHYTTLSLAVAAALVLNFQTHAQQITEQNSTTETEPERIAVTGSRIKGVD